MRFDSVLFAAALSLPLSVLDHASNPPTKTADDVGEKQSVQITVDPQITLAGTLYEPKATKTGAPAAILVHEAGGNRDELKDVAEKLQKQGFMVLALDLRGHGESAKEGSDWSKLDDAGKKAAWTAAIADLRAGITFVRARPNVQVGNLSLIGYRSGCTLVTRYAMRDESVRSIALLDPQTEQYGLNVMKDIEGLGGLPTYVVVAKGDEKDGQRLADAASRASHGAKDALQLLQSKEASGATLNDKRVIPDLLKWMANRTGGQKGKS